ncbi:hypothetical protein Golomagni_00425 [Golovinomyces magnicellulatus]|nr:hypothetical protein Golomagni_00425 [Golovinomyces magnicellulatus]
MKFRLPFQSSSQNSINNDANSSLSISSVEQGNERINAPVVSEHRINEEIQKIKRYEVKFQILQLLLTCKYALLDWVQDASKEQLWRKYRRREKNDFSKKTTLCGWREKVAESFEAAHGWIIITVIGIFIGVNAAFLNIVTEWLSDTKLGYCETAFYLNKSFCCWGEENGGHNYQQTLIFAFISAILVKLLAPYAAGSGISEIKCIIAGFVMKGFLGFWTLIIKSVALPLAIASGLSVGKEGPSVHYAVCTGNVISRIFEKYRQNASKTREILSACAAAGVAVAFGSPIGGVLFSLEEMSSHFPLKTMLRSYFCALVATAVLAAINPFRTGQLVMFQVRYDRSWHFFEVLFFIIIGIFGGIYGEFMIKWNLRAQAFRKKYLTNYAVLESTLLAAGTAIICYPNMFLRIDMTESMEILFLECERAEDYNGLCEANNKWKILLSLTAATIIRMFLVIISYGCKVPAGIFVPSMAIGACFGRTVGILVQSLYEAYPESVFFATCQPDIPCITPGTYAFLGAAAALSGIMHITVSVVVIMFELTGALTYILPTMIVVGVTKAVSGVLGKGGIADRMIWFNGYPFLDNKEDHIFGVPVSQVMASNVVAFPSSGLSLKSIEQLLHKTQYRGFPIVQDKVSKILIGYIGRIELQYAVNRVKKEPNINPDAICHFTPLNLNRDSIVNSQSTSPTPQSVNDQQTYFIDMSHYTDSTLVRVHPRQPLETVMELFRKIGPRVILIEYHGKLAGLVTVKDCLKYQFKAEANENPSEDQYFTERQERLWSWISRLTNVFSQKKSRFQYGRVRTDLSSNSQDASPVVDSIVVPRDNLRRRSQSNNGDINLVDMDLLNLN